MLLLRLAITRIAATSRATLTPSCWQLEAAILPPVGVAEVAEAAVLVGGAPLVPASGTGCQTTLTALLPVLGQRHLL